MTEEERERQVYELVTKLWPRYVTSAVEFREGVWKRCLRHRDVEDIASALQHHRGDEPDARGPKWKVVLGDMKQTYSSGRNDLLVLLDQIREHKIKAGWTEARDYTPEDLFNEHLRAQTAPILFTWHGTTKGPNDLRNTHYLKSIPDPHGLLNWRAAMKIRQITERWRDYHRDAGWPVPEFLMRPDEPIEHPRHTESFAALRRELERGDVGKGILAQSEKELCILHGTVEGAAVRRKALAREAGTAVEGEELGEPNMVGTITQSFLPGGTRDKCVGQGGAVTVEPPSPSVSNGQETMEFRRQDDVNLEGDQRQRIGDTECQSNQRKS
jgi:hypothetical protein